MSVDNRHTSGTAESHLNIIIRKNVRAFRVTEKCESEAWCQVLAENSDQKHLFLVKIQRYSL